MRSILASTDGAALATIAVGTVFGWVAATCCISVLASLHMYLYREVQQ